METQKEIVSIVIFTYNQEQFIEQTINSALAQTYSPLEIVISDDCSNDANQKIITDIVNSYKGEHKIITNFNTVNLGIGKHVSKALSLSNGELILIMGGDDISFPERAAIIHKEWLKSSKLTKGFFSNVMLIDQDGNEKGLLFKKPPSYTKTLTEFIEKANVNKISTEPLCWLLGCSEAIDREVWTSFDEISDEVMQEDAVLAFRSLLLGEIKYIDEPLVRYRRHDNNVFEPTDLNRVLKLLKNEYYYKLQWYTDSLRINASSQTIKVLQSIKSKAAVKHKIYNNRFAGINFLRLKKLIKRLISYKNVQ